jgi:hypothetical protein
MTLFGSNIRIGLGLTGIVLRASLTNLALLNCWAFLHTANIVRLHDYTQIERQKYDPDYQKTEQ